MSKAVVYTLIATATLFFFIVLSLLNLEEPKGRLNRRFGYTILERAPIFDPLVTKIERDQAEKKLSQQHDEVPPPRVLLSKPSGLDSTTSVSEIAETYQYLTSGGKLNTTLRLIILFPLLDRDPKDGVVGFNELEGWITQRALERLDYVTQAELQTKDKNGDLALSFREYLPQFSEKDIEKREMGHGEAGWWTERFDIADIDHNGLLDFTELRDFMHPEDSINQEMLKWMVRDRLKRMDEENDGKLNFNEFEDHVYSTYESYVDFETNGGVVPSAKDKFAELDVNKDQFLSPEELIPILPYLYPGELAYAKYFTCYLMNEVVLRIGGISSERRVENLISTATRIQGCIILCHDNPMADDNGDKNLSLQEMLNHEFIFYNTVHADGHIESDDEHDEL